jgi:hypothetical protein
LNTVFLLLAEFNTGQIPLLSICEKYLSMKKAEALRQAGLQQLPFPVYRAGTQRSPWLVNAEDLAAYLDKQRDEAAKVWTKMKNAS